MLFLFQLLFVLFAVFTVVSVYKKRKEGLLGPKGTIFWIIFWLAVIVVVLWPESAAQIAKMFGIGRGADFILYTSIAVLFYLVFRLHIKIESLGRDVTTVVRKNALDNKNK